MIYTYYQKDLCVITSWIKIVLLIWPNCQTAHQQQFISIKYFLWLVFTWQQSFSESMSGSATSNSLTWAWQRWLWASDVAAAFLAQGQLGGIIFCRWKIRSHDSPSPSLALGETSVDKAENKKAPKGPNDDVFNNSDQDSESPDNSRIRGSSPR